MQVLQEYSQYNGNCSYANIDSSFKTFAETRNLHFIHYKTIQTTPTDNKLTKQKLLKKL